MLRPFPQYSAVTDVYGNVARSNYHSLQLTAEKRRSDDGLSVSFNYTFSRTEDDLSARTGYDFEQDWAVGVNDQPHVWNAIVVYNMPFGAEGRPGSGNPFVRAIVKDWQVSGITQFRSGRPLGSIGAILQSAERGNVLRGFQPELQRPRAHQRRLRRRRRAAARTRRRISIGRRSSRLPHSRSATRRGRSRTI